MDFKNIHIGYLIKNRIDELSIDSTRICKFMNSTENEIKEMLGSKSLDSEIILKWCKLLEYDFFRIYNHHLILYSPPSSLSKTKKDSTQKSVLPNFRKNIYTREIIYFILKQINTGELTKYQVIEKYKIPKTTLYKWIDKYKDIKPEF
ncbi:transposase [Chryseobacterium sp. EO14]|uniref:transposase n=1 Tax=Chryseobacterium sp. EO14 TaxID=2950551 RepID=UPI00210DFE26|nr:transposase [Chryseobacterium sp. EO14]MCQ4142369.1 transposase [Chryseobacterium sp. EO14]